MPPPSAEPSPTPPDWPHCGQGTGADDSVGCRGIHVPGHTACLAHLADIDRDVHLAGLTPGTDIDHRGTTFTTSLLTALFNALREGTTGHPRLGKADFQSATFQGNADFRGATFQSYAKFRSAVFQGTAVFGSAIFEGDARFESAIFQRAAEFRGATFVGPAGFRSAAFRGDAWFKSATFENAAWFRSATFEGDARFRSATFEGDAWFRSAIFEGKTRFESATFQGRTGFEAATFEGDAEFRLATFEQHAGFRSTTFQNVIEFEATSFQGDAGFEEAIFERSARLGPLVCSGRVALSGAVFRGPVTLAFATRRLECRRTRWSSTAELRLRYATVDLAHAVFEYPLTVAAEAAPFVRSNGQQVSEQALIGVVDARVRIASLRGVDAAHLVLADVDLSGCLFTGTVHLDQIRLEGACVFNTVPPAMHWRGWRPIRFTQRRTLAEEHHWRASQPGAVPGWNVAVLGAGRVGPLQLAPVYRALRKAFEDGKHEPGAADFYYGEMEMRRHADDIPRSERSLLTAYWALSGYGMRASRALAWLAAAMLATIVLLMGFGLPQNAAKQEATRTVPSGGGKVTFEIDKTDPQNPTGNRFTGLRFEKALNITLTSVVFRSSGQDLTTTGTYIEMVSRVTEPVLLGLAILAVRSRVKR
ncbi:pentapeptide repeat-containing protein [Streptomyces sp. NPDC058665]|uniref:pentapeptide repeat-containing protein n=1 Tax=Streptomyces sp. NPDC058665 TaxID=3346586 RepID=UPI00364C8697